MVMDDDELIRRYEHYHAHLQIRRDELARQQHAFFNEVQSHMPAAYGHYLMVKERRALDKKMERVATKGNWRCFIDRLKLLEKREREKGKLRYFIDRLKLFFSGCAMTKEARAYLEAMMVYEEFQQSKESIRAHPQLTEDQRQILESESVLWTTKEAVEEMGVFEANYYLRAMRERGIGPYGPGLPAVDDGEHLSWSDDEVEMACMSRKRA